MIELDIPSPPSVNRARKINWQHKRKVDAWMARADVAIMAKRQVRFGNGHQPLDRFEITITLDESTCRLDLDNPVKCAIDYLKRIELIADDSKRHMRRVTLEWGNVPAGCRVTVKEVAA